MQNSPNNYQNNLIGVMLISFMKNKAHIPQNGAFTFYMSNSLLIEEYFLIIKYLSVLKIL